MQQTVTSLLIAISCCILPPSLYGGTDDQVGSLSESYSCGVRCSYFIAALYNRADDSLDVIPARIQQSSDGTSTFFGISNWLQSLGLRPSGRRMRFSELALTHDPVIVQIHTDYGSHFLIWGGMRGNTVRLIDPPKTVEMPEEDFTAKWSGLTLIVQPPALLTSDTGSPLICDNPSVALGMFTLPLTKTPVATFLLRNTAARPVDIHSMVASCGCADTTSDKWNLLPGEVATITCEVSNPANIAGLQRYTIAVRTQEKDVKPLMLEVTVYYQPLVNVRPLRLYFGSIQHAELPQSKIVEVLSRETNEVAHVASATASTPWINCNVDHTGKITVSILNGMPAGTFAESVEVKTSYGSVNIPVTGECVGSVRAVPRLVVLSPERKGTFTVVSAHANSTEAYILHYDTKDLSVRPITPHSEDGVTRRYTVVANNADAPGPYYIDITDPGTNDKTSVCVWSQR